MEWAIAVLVVAVLGGAAAVAAGAFGEMPTEPVRDTYRQELPKTRLSVEDVQRLRFGVSVRGYDMRQVDDAIARLSHEIADRDEQISWLHDTVSSTTR